MRLHVGLICGLGALMAAIAVAGVGARPQDHVPAEAVTLTAFVPSTVFRRGENPFYVVVEIKNNLARTVQVSDHPATLTLHESEASGRTADQTELPPDGVIKALLACEFLYAKSTPARAASRVPEEAGVITIEPGATQLAKLKLDLSVPPSKCRWRLAIRMRGERGERIGPALGGSQTLDVEVVDDRGNQ